ncbi:MAG TPA: CPBP family intramembrane glutamic endopeptidase [Ktedonobacterales bacterium]
MLNSLIVMPLVEEFVFRGFLLDALTASLGAFKTNMTQAVLFSLNHLPWLYVLGLFAHPLLLVGRLVFLAFFGVVCGVLALRTRSLALSTILHAINNLLASG